MAEDSIRYTSEELKGMPVGDLHKMLQGDQKELGKMSFSHKVTPLDNPRMLKEMRRNIARIKTELRARELANK